MADIHLTPTRGLMGTVAPSTPHPGTIDLKLVRGLQSEILGKLWAREASNDLENQLQRGSLGGVSQPLLKEGDGRCWILRMG